MRVEFIELLRCPASHESSPLITVAHQRDGEHLIEATLGCALCGAEYALRDGIVDLRTGRLASPPTDASDQSQLDAASPLLPPEALRVAALLSLADSSARAMLCGVTSAVAGDIEALTGARCIGVNAMSSHRVERSASDTILLTPSEQIPLASASLTGLALDGAHLVLLADATRVVRRGGRILAPAHAAIPFGCTELARDAQEWVAEVQSASMAPVMLQRAAGSHR